MSIKALVNPNHSFQNKKKKNNFCILGNFLFLSLFKVSKKILRTSNNCKYKQEITTKVNILNFWFLLQDFHIIKCLIIILKKQKNIIYIIIIIIIIISPQHGLLTPIVRDIHMIENYKDYINFCCYFLLIIIHCLSMRKVVPKITLNIGHLLRS